MIENCHHMALCAEIAYKDEAEAKSAYKNLGYSYHKYIEVDGAQCHISWNKDNMTISFRGTEPDEFSDIKADLNALPKRGQSGGWVHNGFQGELDKVWPTLKSFIDKNKKERTLYICGHSLGGAMATVAASRMRPDALYTYGSPRVGTRSFVKSFDTPHYRHVNNNDIVPSVPPFFLGYKHHGTLRYINYYGNIRKLTFWQRIKDQWRGRFTALKKKIPFDGAYDHGMNHYVKYTENNNG